MTLDIDNFQAFFFDFDGVLADSVEVKTRAFARLFESYGREIVDRVTRHHRQHGGMTRVDKFRHYYKEFLGRPLNDMELKRLCDAFSQFSVDEVIASEEVAGAENFLKKWSKMLPCFIVSATPDKEIRLIVEKRGLKEYFYEVLGSSKSKQDNIEYLLKKYALTPAKCIMFGDAESDFKAATACGVNFIGIVPDTDAPLLKAAPKIEWAKNFLEVEPAISRIINARCL